MKYKIETAIETKQLESLVNELIQQGWKPLGGVSISNDGHYDMYIQAMIKDES